MKKKTGHTKLTLSKKTWNYIKEIRKKYKVKFSVGKYKDFNISDFLTEDQIEIYSGCQFRHKNQHHIYISSKQVLKDGHDLVALHEIGHMLLNNYNFCHQEEAFANGFAFAMAKLMGLKTPKSSVHKFVLYSEEDLLMKDGYRYVKRPQLVKI